MPIVIYTLVQFSDCLHRVKFFLKYVTQWTLLLVTTCNLTNHRTRERLAMTCAAVSYTVTSLWQSADIVRPDLAQWHFVSVGSRLWMSAKCVVFTPSFSLVHFFHIWCNPFSCNPLPHLAGIYSSVLLSECYISISVQMKPAPTANSSLSAVIKA